MARALGHKLLTRLSEPMDLERFVDEWRRMIPLELNNRLDQLNGLYLLDEMAGKPFVRYFPKNLLPLEPKQRFQDLFLIRKKWSKQDILPFIEELAPNTKALDVIILKYARLSKVGKQVYLTSRLAFLK